MIFSSRTPRDLNRDPKPWVGADLSRRSRYSRFAPRMDPRPEFDHALNNEPNPILVKFREVPADSRWSWHHGFLGASKHVRFAAWTDEQVDHASRVLMRLASFSEVS